ncbi:MAG: hypothetical protein KAJ19_10100, partial [Gammaproteobacteria bacterium]|nr:hypothetical protein [Gammaproteobacteria bacterium]
TVWSFTTGGKASDPVPASGETVDRSAGVLSFSGDDLVSSYDVWFGTVGNLQLVGNYATTIVSFGDLAAAIGQDVLTEGAYQWAVDTKDGSGSLMVAGDVWDVSFPGIVPVTIEDFEAYSNTAELAANWSASGGANILFEDVYNSMQIVYDGASEASLDLSPGQSWAATGMDTFVVSFLGGELNDATGISLTVSDSLTSATVEYQQSDATTSPWWQHWYVRLSDFSDAGVVLDDIQQITINVTDGSGTIRIDDLRLELVGCIAAFQSAGDLSKDCQVTIVDFLMLASDWLMSDFDVTPATPDAGQLLAHYEFDETSGASASDSTSNNYNATVAADDPNAIWNGAGYSGGCIEFDSSTSVTIPAEIFAVVTNEVTISMWVSGNSDDYPDKVNQAIFAAGAASGDENSWDNAAWDIDSAGVYGPAWNHYAAVKNTTTGVMSVYHNGMLVATTTDASEAMEGSLAGESILAMARFDSGTASTVKVDNLRIYGYALSQAEIASLAGGAVVQPIEPIYTGLDI